jgi:CheY-like chemotaxis protein
LIVVDDFDLTMLLKMYLEVVGFIVVTYNDPILALKNYAPEFYDLVVLDMEMPKISGFEFTAD